MTEPLLIKETNISHAWLKTLQHIVKGPGMEITPLILTLTEFEESERFRKSLDLHLYNDKLGSIDTVSETIFPWSLYQYCDYDRNALYEEYSSNLPRIKKIDNSNGRGTYFERLMAYDGKDGKVNQLEIIIKSLQNTQIKRRSKLQAAIFDPSKDHTERPYQSFPCLQHVTFYLSENGGLIINGFYAIQYLYRRAYGNWLGLINLGKFIANQVNIDLERLNCFVGIEHLDHLKKNEAEQILKNDWDILAQAECV